MDEIRRSPAARVQYWLTQVEPAWWRRVLGRCVDLTAATRRRFQTYERPVTPAIVVGSLAVGGAGKTPVVEFLARRYTGQWRVGLVCRGYPFKHLRPREVLSATDVGIGDEAAMLRAALPAEVRIWVSTDLEMGRELASGCSQLVLVDDGFQSTRLKRSFAVVVVDPSASRRVMPAGPLREGWAALACADLVWANGPSMAELGECAEPDGEMAVSDYTIRACTDGSGTDKGANWLRGRPVRTLCGIGRPPQFYRTLTEAGADIVGGYEVVDHGRFKDSVLAEMASGEVPIVTTAKDRVRVPDWLEVHTVVVDLELADEAPLRPLDELVGAIQ